jgi:hypothetical protein
VKDVMALVIKVSRCNTSPLPMEIFVNFDKYQNVIIKIHSSRILNVTIRMYAVNYLHFIEAFANTDKISRIQRLVIKFCRVYKAQPRRYTRAVVINKYWQGMEKHKNTLIKKHN